VLLAVSPLSVSAATTDPVLQWIDVMNTTVLTAGTAPNVTSRVVALGCPPHWDVPSPRAGPAFSSRMALAVAREL
jgi:hypothetical protein